MRKHWKPALALIALVLALALGGSAWVEAQYPAGEAAQTALVSAKGVTVQRTDAGLVFRPEEPVAGLIFYPGGLVDHEAYAPLMRALAEEGVLCVVPEMPLRLAVLDMNAADGVAAQYPEITRWAIGGHSLGGAMAASYAAKHPEEFSVLVLLAAYSTAEIPADMAVVSVYGDADGVLDREKYAKYRANLPEGAMEVVLPGGNHAQFGDYGPQKGDGAAALSAEEQIEQTVQAILPALTGNSERSSE